MQPLMICDNLSNKLKIEIAVFIGAEGGHTSNDMPECSQIYQLLCDPMSDKSHYASLKSQRN